jgi:hypothetical protein
VIYGTLLVIPVEESLLYVRPLYLRSPEGRIPELKRVIVAYQNRIVMAETLVQGLAQIFGRSVAAELGTDRPSAGAMAGAASGEPTPAEPVATPGAPASIAELAAEANRHFENARRALQAGNWAQYGEDMKRVEEILAEIQRIVR